MRRGAACGRERRGPEGLLGQRAGLRGARGVENRDSRQIESKAKEEKEEEPGPKSSPPGLTPQLFAA